jgi:hypothetical protein
MAVAGLWRRPVTAYTGCLPLCDESAVMVDHALCDCEALAPCRRHLATAGTTCPSSTSREAFIFALFRDGERAAARVDHCRFVANTVGFIVRRYMGILPAAQSLQSGTVEFAAADSVDASLRHLASMQRDHYEPPEVLDV